MTRDIDECLPYEIEHFVTGDPKVQRGGNQNQWCVRWQGELPDDNWYLHQDLKWRKNIQGEEALDDVMCYL
jgi:hypothetical protein